MGLAVRVALEGSQLDNLGVVGVQNLVHAIEYELGEVVYVGRYGRERELNFGRFLRRRPVEEKDCGDLQRAARNLSNIVLAHRYHCVLADQLLRLSRGRWGVAAGVWVLSCPPKFNPRALPLLRMAGLTPVLVGASWDYEAELHV